MDENNNYNGINNADNAAGNAGGYVNYNETAPSGNGRPPKKGGTKAVAIVAIVVAGALIVSLFGVFLFYGLPRLVDGLVVEIGDMSVSTGESVGKTDSEEPPQSDLSVPDIVTVSPLPESGTSDITEIYNKCVDSCVTIICEVQVSNGFYTQTGQSLGSGFIIEGNKDGENGYYIVTNHHVIEDAKSITVKYNDGKTYTATLLGSDELTDIAVLKTERTDVSPITMGDSSKLNVGDMVLAIGTPSAEELQNTLSYGIISGLNRKISVTNDSGTVVKTMTVIQTTATLNPGNSGGPLINMAGQVVGINAMKLMDDYEGIGFALPSTEASKIINSLIVYGKVVDTDGSFAYGNAQLGITGATVTDEVRSTYKLSSDCPEGVLVVSVSRGTAVYEAGLSTFDIITEFNGKEVKTIDELKSMISECAAGEKVTLVFYRIGRNGNQSDYQTISFNLDSAQ